MEQGVDCGFRSADFGLWITDYGLRISECGFGIEELRNLRYAILDGDLPLSADSRLLISLVVGFFADR